MPVPRTGFSRARDIGTESSKGIFAILFMATLRRYWRSTRTQTAVSGRIVGHSDIIAACRLLPVCPNDGRVDLRSVATSVGERSWLSPHCGGCAHGRSRNRK
jgi:hypothetical protein